MSSHMQDLVPSDTNQSTLLSIVCLKRQLHILITILEHSLYTVRISTFSHAMSPTNLKFLNIGTMTCTEVFQLENKFCVSVNIQVKIKVDCKEIDYFLELYFENVLLKETL